MLLWPGRVAQSVAGLTKGPDALGLKHTLVETDHEMISAVISPSSDSRRAILSETGKSMGTLY